MRRRKIKTYLFTAVTLLIVAALILIPSLMSVNKPDTLSQVSMVSGTVEHASISTTLSGAGTLAAEEAVKVTIPQGVEITKYLVSNEDVVAEGDAIAKVDRVSVMETISDVQEAMDDLSEEMQELADSDGTDTVTAKVAGRVKKIYVQSGDDVQQAMLTYSGLILISLDGHMAVKFQSEADVTAGEQVSVVLSDGTVETGKVESALDGTVVVTLTDEGPALDEQVQVLAEDGTLMGTGTLYIHSQWKGVAYSGTISAVNVSEEESISAGTELFSLTDAYHTDEYNMLADQHRAYEEQMTELFVLYQEQTVYANASGSVSGIDETAETAAGGEQGTAVELLSSVSDDSSVAYTNYMGTVVNASEGTLELMLQKEPVSVTNYSTIDETSISTDAMDYQKTYTFSSTPVFALVNGVWQQETVESIAAGDVLLFAFDPGRSDGEPVWIVRLSQSTTQETAVESENGLQAYSLMTADIDEESDSTEASAESTTEESTEASGEGATEESTETSTESTTEESEETSEESTAEESTEASTEGSEEESSESSTEESEESSSDSTTEEAGESSGESSSDSSDKEYSSGSKGQGGMPGTQGSGSSTIPDYSSILSGGSSYLTNNTDSAGQGESDTVLPEVQEQAAQNGLTESTVLSIIPQEQMTLTITVDELDILSVSVNQEADITIDALPGQQFSAVVTDIDTSGSNAGGNSKYSVVLTLDKTERMLEGMNASAIITLSTSENIPTVPAAALYEDGAHTYLYTGYDEKEGILQGAVEVTTGISDGEYVEILSGLEEGDTYWYESYDTPSWQDMFMMHQ